ncbi:MAG: putative glycoside hydrolase [Patescibacteria group bacterium]
MTPEPLRAIYMTACVASTPSWRENLKKLIEITELNAVVIDIKDYTGVVSFPFLYQDIEEQTNVSIQKGCVVPDMYEFVQQLHEAGIYVIGRISVFQDPFYTKLFPELAVKNKNDGKIWTDYKGLSFIDVGARSYWDYIVVLSEKTYELGFDEINYDYVRYPSDGNMQSASYIRATSTSAVGLLQTKAETLKFFFEYLHDNLKHPSTGSGQVPVLSVDLFGMTTTVEHDMNIGQVLEFALPYFDYVSPMVYPSHYPSTWNGFANPAEHPYEVVKIAMTKGLERERAWNISNGFFSIDPNGTTTPVSKLRPWLQDFNLGATYGPDKVRAQIQATYDVGLTSWMLWSADNRYTKDALLSE